MVSPSGATVSRQYSAVLMIRQTVRSSEGATFAVPAGTCRKPKKKIYKRGDCAPGWSVSGALSTASKLPEVLRLCDAISLQAR
eukprot:2320874-Pyramimonas_sp.AAC.1